MDTVHASLILMGEGMAAIFVVMLLILAAIKVMGHHHKD
jgi:Na+-transporting methylmalonyl-CoA/oxaloacetate decarboxylase gamma subunit